MKTAIIIPTYNERGNIERLIKDILRLPVRATIIVVDDNSPDGTGKIAASLAKHKRVEVIHRKKKMGLGTAYNAGFKKAMGQGFDTIVTMDADLSHDPRVIPKMLRAFKDSDVVIGSRYVKGGKIVGFGIYRNLLSSFAQRLSRVVLGLETQDSTSGFRAYKIEVIETIKPSTIKSDGYSFLIEAIFRCQKKGFKVAEIPIIFKARTKGKSKVSQIEIFKGLITVVRLKLFDTLR